LSHSTSPNRKVLIQSSGCVDTGSPLVGLG
jgi:hypothetical protein